MSANGLKRCGDIGPLLVFYACDEVEPQEREEIDAHLAVCAACAAQLREEAARARYLSVVAGRLALPISAMAKLPITKSTPGGSETQKMVRHA